LHCAGFITETDSSGNKSLTMPNFDSSNDERVESLRVSLSWLHDTVSTCTAATEVESNSQNNNTSKCCECEIQIRLPIGTTVSGGFMKNDTLQGVCNYVQCYFTQDR